MAENKPYITQTQENGNILISEEVICSIATVAITETEGVAGFASRPGTDLAEMLNMKAKNKGVKVTITEDDQLMIACYLTVAYGAAVVNVAKAVQENVIAAIESMTGLKVADISVNICAIAVK